MASTLRRRMGALTIEALRAGIHNSDDMREFISRELGLDIDWQFTNTHAWALVDLQASGDIVKQGRRDYALATQLTSEQYLVPAPSRGRMPAWARTLVARANRRNGVHGPRFTDDDLIAAWRACGGKCAITRRPFSFKLIGKSLVKRAYAPSLDRIRAGEPYTRQNCRLVMVAINFAMNAWGEDVYLDLARSAVESAPD